MASHGFQKPASGDLAQNGLHESLGPSKSYRCMHGCLIQEMLGGSSHVSIGGEAWVHPQGAPVWVREGQTQTSPARGVRDRAVKERGGWGHPGGQPGQRSDRGGDGMGVGQLQSGQEQWGLQGGRGTGRGRGVLRGGAEFEGFRVVVQAGFLGEMGV
ncbi:hypothetical protein HPG69_017463 [Diceros bicornis minor]|uniref:Uncharacterized protein n=1 Tax=Diceros bicornis minor TaxID=77932 RepID=A0A7J7EDC3_DICBM|nr:hypothetical protein HPG69_017463 [Diceros bicornis minor]